MKRSRKRNDTIVPELRDYQLRHKSSSYVVFFEKFVRQAVGTSYFDRCASKMLLRNIVTVGDEAFCMLVYENQNDRWNEIAKPENEGKKLQIEAMYTSGGGGKDVPNRGHQPEGHGMVKGWHGKVHQVV